MDEDQKTLKLYRPQILCGIDEAGRGPLAGPVVSACCALWGDIEEGLEILKELGVRDSKRLSSSRRREKLSLLGLKSAVLLHKQRWVRPLTPRCWLGLSSAESSVERVDQINILQATLEAMSKSFQGLARVERDKGLGHEVLQNFFLLVDGNTLPQVWRKDRRVKAVIKGDMKSLLIATASIVAKEVRDALMKELHQKWPLYGFAQNAGYPTAQHKRAIRCFGVSPSHRKTFKGVKEYL